MRSTLIKLKVCGMRSQENILEVAALLPDYMGFIFFKGSKRFVGDHFAMPSGFPSSVQKVGVFVNETTDRIVELAKYHKLDLVQLHGDESSAQCNALKKEGLSVIKAFSIDVEFDFSRLDEYEAVVDYFLFDTKGPSAGGNGTLFDWSVLNKYEQRVPFFLSGGISVADVDKIDELMEMNIHAIDVNSRVENDIALKNSRLIKEIQDKLIQFGR